MELITKLINDKTPFALMRYYVTPKFETDNAMSCYELLYIGEPRERKAGKKSTVLREKKPRKAVLKKTSLSQEVIQYIKQHTLVKNVLTNDYGSIWEFNGFKNFVHSNKLIVN